MVTSATNSAEFEHCADCEAASVAVAGTAVLVTMSVAAGSVVAEGAGAVMVNITGCGVFSGGTLGRPLQAERNTKMLVRMSEILL